MNTQTYFHTLAEAKKYTEPKQFRDSIQFAKKAAQEFKEKEIQLIEALQEVDRLKSYRRVGFNSLFTFVTLGLGLSEYQAMQYISVARKSLEVPELKTALENKELTISKAHRVCSVITPQNQTLWLEEAKTSSKRELERKVAGENPKSRRSESVRYINDTELDLSLTLSEENFKKLQQVKILLNQEQKKNLSLDEVIGLMSEFYIEKKDPVRKAERAKMRSLKKDSERITERAKKPGLKKSHEAEKSSNKNDASEVIASLEPSLTRELLKNSSRENTKIIKIESASNENLERQPSVNLACKDTMFHGPGKLQAKEIKVSRTAIPKSTLHQVHLRDRRQCQYSIKGHGRCDNSQWLEIHHILPLSQGGDHSLDNLTTLCSQHHKWVHEELEGLT